MGLHDAASEGFFQHLGRQIVAAMLLWGVPMGMMFSAGMVLDTLGHPMKMALMIAVAMGISLVGGAAFGVLIYVIVRVADVRKAQ